jgi:hypothetical protein
VVDAMGFAGRHDLAHSVALRTDIAFTCGCCIVPFVVALGGHAMPLAEFSIDASPNVGTVLVEVDPPRGGGMQPASGHGDGIAKASGTLQDALALLKPLTHAPGAAVAEIGPDARVHPWSPSTDATSAERVSPCPL